MTKPTPPRRTPEQIARTRVRSFYGDDGYMRVQVRIEHASARWVTVIFVPSVGKMRLGSATDIRRAIAAGIRVDRKQRGRR